MKPVSIKTVCNELTSLSGLLVYAKKIGVIAKSPMVNVTRPVPNKDPVGRALTKSQCHLLIAELAPLEPYPLKPVIIRWVSRNRAEVECLVCGKRVLRPRSAIRGATLCGNGRCTGRFNRSLSGHHQQDAYDFFVVMLHTGCRKGELQLLHRDDVLLASDERGSILIRTETSKSKRSRYVPLTKTALEILSRRLTSPARDDGLVFGPVNHRRALLSAARRAGLGHLRQHDLRHAMGSLLMASGASAAEVRDILGHRDLAMSNRYVHSAEEYLQRRSPRTRAAG